MCRYAGVLHGSHNPFDRTLILGKILIMSRPFNTPDAYRAVAHPARRRILDLLLPGERSAGDLAAAFRFRGSTLSEHLRALRIAGLVHERQQGAKRIYRRAPGALREIARWLDRHRS